MRLAPRALGQLAGLGDEAGARFTRRLLGLAQEMVERPRIPEGLVQEIESDGVVGLFEVDHEDGVLTVLNIGSAAEAVPAPRTRQHRSSSHGVRNRAKGRGGRSATPTRRRKEGMNAHD